MNGWQGRGHRRHGASRKEWSEKPRVGATVADDNSTPADNSDIHGVVAPATKPGTATAASRQAEAAQWRSAGRRTGRGPQVEIAVAQRG